MERYQTILEAEKIDLDSFKFNKSISPICVYLILMSVIDVNFIVCSKEHI